MRNPNYKHYDSDADLIGCLQVENDDLKKQVSDMRSKMEESQQEIKAIIRSLYDVIESYADHKQ